MPRASKSESPVGLRELNVAARRERILEAARRLIAAGGMPALSMRKLAREAGLSVFQAIHAPLTVRSRPAAIASGRATRRVRSASRRPRDGVSIAVSAISRIRSGDGGWNSRSSDASIRRSSSTS